MIVIIAKDRSRLKNPVQPKIKTPRLVKLGVLAAGFLFFE
jgi:hypothetical protein